MADQVTIIDTPPPAAPPAPSTSIQASQMAPASTPAAPPKPGSARDRLFQELQKKGKPAFGTAPEPEPNPTPDPKPQDKPAAQTTQDPNADPKKIDAPPAVDDKTKPAVTDPDKKADKSRNPWRMVDEWKDRATKAEAELLEARKGALPVKERETYETRVKQAEERVAELEREMRFVDFTKTQEFQDKYQKPYEAAWTRATSELKELVVVDPTTNENRLVTPQDILNLVNLPLMDAHNLAKEMSPDFFQELMAHRKEIRGLFDQQAHAIEEARKNAANHMETRSKQATEQDTQVRQLISEAWGKANDEIVRHEKYGSFFTPTEADEQVNQRLAKGFELVDRAMAENPLDPKLTPEQRQSVIRRHAAVRNRAAAFGRVVYELNALRAEYQKVMDELKTYKGSEPRTTGGGVPPGQGGAPSAKATVFDALRRLAK